MACKTKDSSSGGRIGLTAQQIQQDLQSVLFHQSQAEHLELFDKILATATNNVNACHKQQQMPEHVQQHDTLPDIEQEMQQFFDELKHADQSQIESRLQYEEEQLAQHEDALVDNTCHKVVPALLQLDQWLDQTVASLQSMAGPITHLRSAMVDVVEAGTATIERSTLHNNSNNNNSNNNNSNNNSNNNNSNNNDGSE
jgi:hypothetical protein